MAPVRFVLPESQNAAQSFLNPIFPDNQPEACPAVVGGNTEVSQRLVDTLLKALGLAACSYGTMNNFLFGGSDFGYYETIGGGTGATVGANGRSAVHQHMTNTKLTDPEELERRYPVRLREFSIRAGSGGAGKWQGGDGIVREIEFLEPVQATLLSQHRVVAPYGLNGGEPGQVGQQTLILADGRTEALPGIFTRAMHAEERIRIETPGGGGAGEVVSGRNVAPPLDPFSAGRGPADTTISTPSGYPTTTYRINAMTTEMNKMETKEQGVKNIQPNIGLDKDVLKKDNEMLNAYLADLHVVYIKTRKYHWNVAGPSFKEYHEFFEEQYHELEEVIDQVAERIRMLGGKPFATMADFIAATSLKEDQSGEVKTLHMFERLLSDHEQITRELRDNVNTADEELKDAGTADFLTGLMETHEKMAWMLRKYLS